MPGIEVRVEISGNRVALVNPERFPGDNEMCKMIPGHSFRKTPYPHWTYPLSLATCRDLRRVFKDMLVVGPELSEWAKGHVLEARRLARLGRRSSVSLARIPEEAPWIARAMEDRKYQTVGTRFLAEAAPGCMILDDPGLGKTLQALASLVEGDRMFGGHLIAGPVTSLKPVWLESVQRWLRTDEVFVAYGGAAKRQKVIDEFWERDVDTKFLIINPEMLSTEMGKWCEECGKWEDKNNRDDQRGMPADHFIDKHSTERRIKEQKFPDLFEIPWKSAIADEAHQYLHGNRGPQKKTLVAEGFCRLQYDDDPVRIATTGSSYRGRVGNIWGILNWLRPEEYPSYWHWAEHYLHVVEGRFGSSVGDVMESREKEYFEDLDRLGIRRTKREVQPETPEIQRHDVWVEMNEAQARAYKAMELEGEARMEDGDFVSPLGILAQFSRLKQLAFGTWKVTGWEDTVNKTGAVMHPVASPKFDYFVEFLSERGITGKKDTEWRPDDKMIGHKVVFSSQYTHVVDFVIENLEKLGISCAKITGATTPNNRTRIAAEFQEYDGPRVLGLQTITGGQSITLDAYCDEGVIFDETWVPDDQEQVEGRINNRNPEQRIHSVDWYYIRTKNTVDVDVANRTLTKEHVQRKLLDIRRGVKVSLREIQKGQ